ncbi:MAG: hypothetical protein KA806_02730 [Sulfuritalea sp.]|nr:hypothetical protein [Sulfuritalea sp.]
MSIAVIVAPENHAEAINDQLTFTLFGLQLRANDLWGQKTMVKKIICDKFGNPHLFEAR